jgi:hypothetical protein
MHEIVEARCQWLLTLCSGKQVSAALRAAAPKDAATVGVLEGQLRLVDTWIRVRVECPHPVGKLRSRNVSGSCMT